MLNADGMVGSTGELLSNNMFAYSKNNPVNMSDPSGFRPIFSATLAEETEEMRKASFSTMRIVKTAFIGNKSLKESITSVGGLTKPLLYIARKKLSERNGTCTKGINVSALAGGGIYTSVGLSTDWKGNIAVQFSSGFGGGIPNLSASVYKTTTNASSIYALEGWGTQAGGSGGVFGFALGMEQVILDGYLGNTTSIGYGIAPPIEMHGEAGYTWTLWDINIYDVIEDKLNKVDRQ